MATEVDLRLLGWEPVPSQRSMLAVLIEKELEVTGAIDSDGLECALGCVTEAVQLLGIRSISDFERAPGRSDEEVYRLLRSAQALVP